MSRTLYVFNTLKQDVTRMIPDDERFGQLVDRVQQWARQAGHEDTFPFMTRTGHQAIMLCLLTGPQEQAVEETMVAVDPTPDAEDVLVDQIIESGELKENTIRVTWEWDVNVLDGQPPAISFKEVRQFTPSSTTGQKTDFGLDELPGWAISDLFLNGVTEIELEPTNPDSD